MFFTLCPRLPRDAWLILTWKCKAKSFHCKSVTICGKHCNAFARYLRCYCCPLWLENTFKGYWNLSTWNNPSFDLARVTLGTCSPLPKSNEHERRTRRHALLHIFSNQTFWTAVIQVAIRITPHYKYNRQ